MRDSTSHSTAVVTVIVLAVLVAVLYPVVAAAGERQQVFDQRSRTVGYVEPDACGSDKLVVRDRGGRTV